MVAQAWGEKHQESLDTLKKILITDPVLASPKFRRPFVIETDASKEAIAAALLQEDDEREEDKKKSNPAAITQPSGKEEQVMRVISRECGEKKQNHEVIGVTQSQKSKSGRLKPVLYASRKCTKHERNYSAVELEALAVAYAIREFRPYIEGSGTLTIRTDNSGLCSLLKRRDLEGRLARYQLAIQAYDIKFEHRAGRTSAVGPTEGIQVTGQ